MRRLREICPDKRTLFFSRSSYVGAHRYGGIWQGDNKSWWSHILQSMQQLPALNMAGFLFTGSDTGGFGCDTTEDLMLRWLQYSCLRPCSATTRLTAHENRNSIVSATQTLPET